MFWFNYKPKLSLKKLNDQLFATNNTVLFMTTQEAFFAFLGKLCQT